MTLRTFVSKLWIPLALGIGIIILWLAEQLQYTLDPALRALLPGMTGVVSATVLFALWKIEEDLRGARVALEMRIDEQTKQLKSEIEDNERAIHLLFSAFRQQFGDDAFETSVKKLVLRYPELKKVDAQHLIAHLALKDLTKLSSDLDEYAYEADIVGVIDHYPKPFYEAAHSSIKATDIVTKDDEYWPRVHWDQMINLNIDTLRRMRRTPPNGVTPTIQRIFILSDNLTERHREEAFELMDRLAEEGIQVCSIQRGLAEEIIQGFGRADGWRKVHNVEDFSIFDASGGKVTYAGRFRDKGKTVVITTDKTVITELETQFQLLWRRAEPYLVRSDDPPPVMWS